MRMVREVKLLWDIFLKLEFRMCGFKKFPEELRLHVI